MNYYSLNQYLRDRFGCKVYKLSLNAGLTCPNRDGTLGTGGCIFCSRGGSGEFAAQLKPGWNIQFDKAEKKDGEDPEGEICRQLQNAKKQVAAKAGTCKYIAYFQAFTNTYGPVSYLRRIFMEAITQEDVVAISIATRPDCLGEDVLSLLEELNRIKPVWVELGLQTIHEATAAYIRRGYDLPVYDQAVAQLRERGIEVIVHIILGLPGETKEQMKETVAYVGGSGVQGVKLQLLHVLEGTDLAEEYRAGKVPVMELEEYAALVADCIALLPEKMVIHRMTGDGDKRLLLAPKWSGHKKKVLNTIRKYIKEKVRQP